MDSKKIKFPAIEYHADDFGLFDRQSRRIMGCQEQGRMNGVSVIPNGEALPACMDWLSQRDGVVAVTIHLNLIEGHCLTQPAPKLGLTDAQGNLAAHFPSLLLHSFLPGRKARQNWLKGELTAQIQAVASHFHADAALRIDSHAHYHMLPVVFDALIEVIRENHLNVSYIRIPREYPILYLRHWRELQDFSPINLVKVLILNILALRNCIRHRDFLCHMEKKLFLGVFLSGSMHRGNVDAILSDAVKLAKKEGWDLEVLSHPGGVEEPEDIVKLTSREDVAFLTSPMRQKEVDLFLF